VQRVDAEAIAAGAVQTVVPSGTHEPFVNPAVSQVRTLAAFAEEDRQHTPLLVCSGRTDPLPAARDGVMLKPPSKVSRDPYVSRFDHLGPLRKNQTPAAPAGVALRSPAFHGRVQPTASRPASPAPIHSLVCKVDCTHLGITCTVKSYMVRFTVINPT
jgi:hypothetical protein